VRLFIAGRYAKKQIIADSINVRSIEHEKMESRERKSIFSA